MSFGGDYGDRALTAEEKEWYNSSKEQIEQALNIAAEQNNWSAQERDYIDRVYRGKANIDDPKVAEAVADELKRVAEGKRMSSEEVGQSQVDFVNNYLGNDNDRTKEWIGWWRDNKSNYQDEFGNTPEIANAPMEARNAFNQYQNDRGMEAWNAQSATSKWFKAFLTEDEIKSITNKVLTQDLKTSDTVEELWVQATKDGSDVIHTQVADFADKTQALNDKYGAELASMSDKFTGAINKLAGEYGGKLDQIADKYKQSADNAIGQYGEHVRAALGRQGKMLDDALKPIETSAKEAKELANSYMTNYESTVQRERAIAQGYMDKFSDVADQSRAEQGRLQRQLESTTAKELGIQKNYVSDYNRYSREAFSKMGTADEDILSRQRGQQLAGISQSYKEAQKDLIATLSRRGLAGSGTEAGAIGQLSQQEAQAKAQALSQSYTQSVDMSDQRRMTGIGLEQGIAQQGIAQSQGAIGATQGQTQIGLQGIAQNVQAAGMEAQTGINMSNQAVANANAIAQLGIASANQQFQNTLQGVQTTIDAQNQMYGNEFQALGTQAGLSTQAAGQAGSTAVGAGQAAMSGVTSALAAGFGAQQETASNIYGINATLQKSIFDTNVAEVQQNISNFASLSAAAGGAYMLPSNMLQNSAGTYMTTANTGISAASNLMSGNLSYQNMKAEQDGAIAGIFGSIAGGVAGAGTSWGLSKF